MNDHILPINASVGEVNSFLRLWKENGGDMGKVSDTFHSFDELYEHRIANYMALCNTLAHSPKYHELKPVWKSQTHSDGSSWDGWFVLGIGEKPGEQVTYHLPMSKFQHCWFARTIEKAPTFDGHTSADVLERLKNL